MQTHSPMTQDDAKRLVGERVADWIRDGMVLGLGTGSTAAMAIEALGRLYSSAEVDHLDGITVQEADWWFNVRKSNTEPLLRLNLEAKTKKAMQKHLAEVAQHLGKPVAH